MIDVSGSLPAQQAAIEFELSTIEHPQLTDGLVALAQLQARARTLKGGKSPKARGLVLMGDAGAGKTTIVELWKELNPQRQTQDGIITPVVVVEVPQATNLKSLIKTIYESMGYHVRRNNTTIDLVNEIANRTRLMGVELIILDEAHHIIDGKEPEPVSEFLKSLLNRMSANMVFVGLPQLAEISKISKQFDRRLAPDVILKPYDWTDKAGRVEFLTILSKMEENLGLPLPSNLSNQALARRIYAATRGEIGLVSKYLSQALSLALQRGLERIDLALLAEIDARWHPAQQPANVIGFDDDLVVDEAFDLDALTQAARKPLLNPLKNPFACSNQQLLTILHERMEDPSRFVQSNRRPSRRARGTGPKPLTAFR